MGRPQVRVTQLEAFRRCMLTDEYEYATEQSLIDNITGTFMGNPYTKIGTAFHSIVETGAPVCEKVEGGRVFDIGGTKVALSVEQCRLALSYRNEHPCAIHEFREFMDYGIAEVTGQADMLDGLEIRDIKTKFSPVCDSDYTKSVQWKYYMELFGCETFHFDLFVFDGYEQQMGTDVRGLDLRRHDPITTFYYRGLEDDNRHVLSEFMQWARFRHLEDYLRYERQS